MVVKCNDMNINYNKECPSIIMMISELNITIAIRIIENFITNYIRTNKFMDYNHFIELLILNLNFLPLFFQLIQYSKPRQSHRKSRERKEKGKSIYSQRKKSQQINCTQFSYCNTINILLELKGIL